MSIYIYIYIHIYICIYIYILPISVSRYTIDGDGEREEGRDVGERRGAAKTAFQFWAPEVGGAAALKNISIYIYNIYNYI